MKSFPAGSAAGPDGLRAQHLKELIVVPGECGESLLMHVPARNYVNHIQPPESPNPVTQAAPLPVGSSSRLGPFHRMHAASLSHPESLPPPVRMPLPWSGGIEPTAQHANMPVIYFSPPAGPSNSNGAFDTGNHAELMPGFMQMGMPMPPFQQTVFTFRRLLCLMRRFRGCGSRIPDGLRINSWRKPKLTYLIQIRFLFALLFCGFLCVLFFHVNTRFCCC
ncbi:uncharacterized protein LOC129592988 [Paramacrobiotus metropolitanus]|uniref:uncharacterized protein LOC129592988 n=1 Tax=Paramacrobiotus metropolitanus TaxID=2943436 RepID=UPI0024458015|nr:uncharacterized protein LOC129592988 [Paramacrobiotus metropolitanus]